MMTLRSGIEISLSAGALTGLLAAAGCGPTASETVPPSSGSPLLLTITMHLENKTMDSAYFASLDGFAKTFEQHGGKLTMEPRDSTVMAAAGPPMLLDWKTLEARGHAVGSHAAIGGTTSTTLTQFTMQARMRHDQLQPRVSRLDHVSGNCGNVDWVTGVADGGFALTTATTVLCLYAMAPADRPAPYQSLSCTSSADPVCHTPYPAELAQRVHPWRAKDGAHWLTDDPTGRLVVLPGSGTLPCLEEEANSSGGSLPTCTLTAEDVTRAMTNLDAAIALRDANKLNTFYWVWGSWSISTSEQPVLENFLIEVDKRVAKGEVKWSTATQMYDAYLDWEKSHR